MQSHGEAAAWNAPVLGDEGLRTCHPRSPPPPLLLCASHNSDEASARSREGVGGRLQAVRRDGRVRGTQAPRDRALARGHDDVSPRAERRSVFPRAPTLADARRPARGRILTTMPGPHPPVAYDALVLVEPSLCTRPAWDAHLEEREGALVVMSKLVMKRRDAWASRADARAYFTKRLPWTSWDPRVLELYIVRPLCQHAPPCALTDCACTRSTGCGRSRSRRTAQSRSASCFAVLSRRRR